MLRQIGPVEILAVLLLAVVVVSALVVVLSRVARRPGPESREDLAQRAEQQRRAHRPGTDHEPPPQRRADSGGVGL